MVLYLPHLLTETSLGIINQVICHFLLNENVDSLELSQLVVEKCYGLYFACCISLPDQQKFEFIQKTFAKVLNDFNKKVHIFATPFDKKLVFNGAVAMIESLGKY